MTTFLSDDENIDRSFTAARRRLLLEKITPLPFRDDKPEYFITWLSILIDVCVNLNAIDRTLPELEPNNYRSISTYMSRACKLIIDTFEIERRVLVTNQTATLEKIKAFLAVSDTKKKNTEKELRKTMTTTNSQDKQIRDAVWLYNPLVLRRDDFRLVGDYGALVRYGITQANNMSVLRTRQKTECVLLHGDGEAAKRGGRGGAGVMEPIHNRRKYWQTLECWERGHNSSPFYKYHALVWGRRLYANCMKSLGWDKCPVYQLDLVDFINAPIQIPQDSFAVTNRLTDASSQQGSSSAQRDSQLKLSDAAYLELAELDFIGRLRGMAALPSYETSPPIFMNLPTYRLHPNTLARLLANGEELNDEHFYRIDELEIIREPAHRRAGLFYEPNSYGTSQSMFSVMMFTEKAKLGIISKADFAYVRDLIVQHTSDDKIGTKARAEIKSLNDTTPQVRWQALQDRKEILASLPKQPAS